jgi:hypothetical protein
MCNGKTCYDTEEEKKSEKTYKISSLKLCFFPREIKLIYFGMNFFLFNVEKLLENWIQVIASKKIL